MDDRQYSVPAASANRAAGSDGHFKSLVSAIERSGISAFTPQFVFAATTPSAPWAPRCDDGDTDIDTEILQWIVSHVPSAKRSKAH
jgi:hypothetical protein